jgi:3',5'-cyclic AMP phosphodiesterase CpdA
MFGVIMKHKLAFLFVFVIAVVIPGSGQEPFYFVMLSDPQFGIYTRDRSFAQETANYEFAVATVNRLKPGFVIVLGDLINKTGDPEQLREYLRISRKIDPSIAFYSVAGNHDVGAQPTPETLDAFRKDIGRDYYSFRAGPVYGIVLNSCLMMESSNAVSEYEEQISWLKTELEMAKSSGAQQIIVFQHHPYFMTDAREPDGIWNVPAVRRQPILELLRTSGVRYVFAGHTHRNNVAKDGELEVVTSGPVGMPLGEDGSGIRIAIVNSSGIQHRYYDFGKLPNQLTIK